MHASDPPQEGASLEERYRVLLEIGRTLAGTLSLDELFSVLYRETSRVLETTGFYVAIYDEATDVATVAYHVDQGRESREEVTYRGSSSEVIRTGRPSIVFDRGDVPSLLVVGERRAEITRSAIAAPLRHKGRTLGAISVQSYQPRMYGAADLELLQGIADIAAVAVENAHFVAELDRQKKESERIEEVGRTLSSSLEQRDVLARVIEAALDLIRADGATVWHLEEDVAQVAASGGEISLPIGMQWQLDEHLLSQLVGDRTTVHLADFETDPHLPEDMRQYLRGGSGLAVPLVVDGNVAGILSLGSRKVRSFTTENRRILRRLARQAAVALENAGLHQSVQALSLTDPLTGLPNRRHLQLHLDREVAAARRGRDLVVVVFDLDNFKRYNDTHGHLAGDEVLRAFGRILATENRAMNLVARMGGDEFVSVLSDATLMGARTYLGRVREQVRSDAMLASGGITVSSGTALFDRATMRTAQEALEAADADLYREKAQKGAAD